MAKSYLDDFNPEMKDCYDRNHKSDNVPVFGYQLLQRYAQESDYVTVPLYAVDQGDGPRMMVPLGIGKLQEKMTFFTDVNSCTASSVWVYPVKKLDKSWVLNAEGLPRDDAGDLRWDKVFDEVYCNHANYVLTVDWLQAVHPDNEGNRRWEKKSLAEAKKYDADWRKKLEIEGLERLVQEFNDLAGKAGVTPDAKTAAERYAAGMNFRRLIESKNVLPD